MANVRPEHDQAFWEALAQRPWRRVKWRRGDEGPASATCIAYGTPIHRTGTYYVRPAYTDGADWLSQQAYDEMVRRTLHRRATRRYSQAKRGDTRP